MIDSYDTVIRLKGLVRKDQPREHFGTRTDIVCARSHLFEAPGVPFWHFAGDIEARSLKHYTSGKPSTGLCAVFCALEYLKPEVITVIGFDQLLYGKGGKYNDRHKRFAHNGGAEAECLKRLPVKIIDLAREHEQVRRF